MERAHADQDAKQKADMEAKTKEIQAFETNRRFLEHDLAQARHETSKRLKSGKPAPTRLVRRTSQSLPYRDGFDDHEIVTLSPSKNKDRSKPSTPKVGEKRKRNAAVSPAPQLQLNAQPSVSSSPAANPADPTSAIDDLIQSRDASTLQFEVGFNVFIASSYEADIGQMIRRLMNHRPLHSQERVLETLTRLSFPSLPGQSISGLVSSGLSGYVGVDEEADFASFACNLFSDLWERCLQDKMASILSRQRISINI